MTEPKALALVVSGRVQGVFYRASMRTEAERLGVRGWVHNEDDGTVHAHLEGDPDAVDELVAWSREGPPKARVDQVRVVAADVSGNWSNFED